MEMSLARENLITENYHLIHYVIKNLIDTTFLKNNPLLDYEDLVQFGAIGLCKAADSYDASRGAFSTLACTIIRNTILQELRTKKKNSFECTDMEEELLPGSMDPALSACDLKLLLSSVFCTMERSGEKDIQLKKSLLILLYEGYSLRAAARALHITNQKARVAVNHIKKYIKLAYGE